MNRQFILDLFSSDSDSSDSESERFNRRFGSLGTISERTEPQPESTGASCQSSGRRFESPEAGYEPSGTESDSSDTEPEERKGKVRSKSWMSNLKSAFAKTQAEKEKPATEPGKGPNKEEEGAPEKPRGPFRRRFKRRPADGTPAGSSAEEKPQGLKKGMIRSPSAERELEFIRNFLFPADAESSDSDWDPTDSDPGSESDFEDDPDQELPPITKAQEFAEKIRSWAAKVRSCFTKMDPASDGATTTSGSESTGSSSSCGLGIRPRFIDTDSIYLSSSPPLYFREIANEQDEPNDAPRSPEIEPQSRAERFRSWFHQIRHKVRESETSSDSGNTNYPIEDLEVSLRQLVATIFSKPSKCTENFDSESLCEELLRKILSRVSAGKIRVDWEDIRTELHTRVHRELLKHWESPEFVQLFTFLRSRVAIETIAAVYAQQLTRRTFGGSVKRLFRCCRVRRATGAGDCPEREWLDF